MMTTEEKKLKKRNIDKLYRLKNKEKIKLKKSEYYQKIKNNKDFKEKRKEYQKYYNQTPKRKEWNRLHKRKNYKRDKERQNKYWAKNPEKHLKFLEWKKIYNKNYKKKHKEKISLQRKEKLKKDKNFNIRNILRSRMYTVLKRKKSTKLNSTLDLLGVKKINTVINHLESKFKKGMSWDNHGDWHIDHIIPCASFDLTKEENQKKCFNYKNLQPLWALENMKKGCKLITNNKKI